MHVHSVWHKVVKICNTKEVQIIELIQVENNLLGERGAGMAWFFTEERK